MMTFSLKPFSMSTLPSVEASVRTRVVSWKEAAEMKDSVSSEALVIPSRIGSASRVCRRPHRCACSRARRPRIDLLAPEELAVTRIGDANLAEHLADDDLDVLVVDRHTLETIDFLHLEIRKS
jgi:hypothetical protein